MGRREQLHRLDSYLTQCHPKQSCRFCTSTRRHRTCCAFGLMQQEDQPPASGEQLQQGSNYGTGTPAKPFRLFLRLFSCWASTRLRAFDSARAPLQLLKLCATTPSDNPDVASSSICSTPKKAGSSLLHVRCTLQQLWRPLVHDRAFRAR